MLVYDITNEKSFENIRNWIRNIEEVKIYNFLDSLIRVFCGSYSWLCIPVCHGFHMSILLALNLLCSGCCRSMTASHGCVLVLANVVRAITLSSGEPQL
jgi:Ras family